MQEVYGRSDNGWIACLGGCALLCTADTVLPVGDAVGAGASAARFD